MISALRKARVDTCTLDAEEDEHRNEHRRPHLIEQAYVLISGTTEKIALKEVEAEGREQDKKERDDRNDLGDGHNLIDECSLLCPAQDEGVKERFDRRDGNCRDRVAVPEDRKECTEGRLDEHPVRHIADAGSNPVSKDGEKS